MSLGPLLARISQIETAIADPGSLVAGATRTAAAPTASVATPSTSAPTATAASAAPSFASLLGSAGAPGSTSSQQAVSEAETLNSIYGMEALQSLSGDSSSASSSGALDPVSQLLSALGPGTLGQSATTAVQTPASALGSLTSPAAAAGTGVPTSSGLAGNQAIVQIAETQAGQVEQPFGSNNGPAISMYRTAVAGAGPGEPWCAQFASWVARQAGTPLGSQGQGFSSVADVWSWAQQTGRAIPNGPGVVPAPGDLIVFGDEHVGIVTGVQPNGDIDTVEGNYDNQVVNNVRGPNEATGYVNMSA